MAKLRPRIIRLAASLPKGSSERRMLLAVLTKNASTFSDYVEDAKHKFLGDILDMAEKALWHAGAKKITREQDGFKGTMGDDPFKVSWGWVKHTQMQGSVEMWNSYGSPVTLAKIRPFDVEDQDAQKVALKVLRNQALLMV